MKLRYTLAVILGAAILGASPAHAILGLFEKSGLREAPDADELSNQQAVADELFDAAKELQAAGRPEKARSNYEKIVKHYPLTTLGPSSQFQIGQCREAEGEGLKAFDAYQLLIDNYKQSDLFGEAVKRQFELATKSMNAKTGRFLGMRAKAQTSRVIELFQQVAANAPFTNFAPLSHYNIGILEADTGHDAQAIAAFQTVVDNYGGSEYAAEARHQIIQIREGNAVRDDQAFDEIALEKIEFSERHPDDPRAEQHLAQVGKLEDRDAEKKFNIGRFYENKDNLRAAAIYYQQVRPGTTRHADAQARLDEIRATDPNLVMPPRGVRQKLQAPVDVVNKPDYVGPPPPKLTGAAAPKMRTSDEDVLPIPSGE